MAEALQALRVPAPVEVQAGGEHLVVEGEVDEEAALCQHCQHQPCAVTAVCSPVLNNYRHASRQYSVGSNSNFAKEPLYYVCMEGLCIQLPVTM